MLNQLLLVALSLPGLAVWRWLMVADRPSFAAPPAPKHQDGGPITLNSDYRGIVL